MATVGNIATRITLEGAEEVKAALADLQKSGEAALAKLKTAAPGSNFDALEKSIAGVNKSGETLVSNVSQIAVAFNNAKPAIASFASSMTGVVGSITNVNTSFLNFKTLTIAGVVAGLLAIEESASKSLVALNKAGAAAGISFENFQVLARAARASGLDLEDLTRALRKFTQEVDSQGQAQFKSFIDLTKQLVTEFGQGASIKFIDFKDFEKVKRAAEELAPKVRDAFAAIGDQRANQSLQQIAAQIERLALTSEDARKKLAAIGLAVPGQNAIERLDQLVEKSKGDFASLKISLIGLGTSIRTPEAALIDFIDKVSKMATDAERSTAIIKLFGRQAGPELVNFISKGTENIDAISQKMRELGIIFSQDDLFKAKESRKSFRELNETVSQLKNELGIALAPAAALLFKTLNTAVQTSSKSLKQWASDLANSVAPAVAGFAKAILGIDIDKSLNLSPDQILKANEWKETFDNIRGFIVKFINESRTFFTNTFPVLFGGALKVLDTFAAGLEKLTGIKLSGEQLGFALITTQLLGINGVVLDLIKTFGLLLIAGTAVLGAPGLVSLAALAFGAFAIWDFSPIVARSLKAWTDIRDQWSKSPFTALSTLFKAQLQNVADIAAKVPDPRVRILGEGLKAALSKAFDDPQAAVDALDQELGQFAAKAIASGKSVGDSYAAGFNKATQSATALEQKVDSVSNKLKVVSTANPFGAAEGSSIRAVSPNDRPGANAAGPAAPLVTAFTEADARVRAILDGLAQSASEITLRIGAGFSDLAIAVQSQFQAAADAILASLDRVAQKVQEIVASMQGAGLSGSGVGFGGGGGSGFATGGLPAGLLGGRGSGRSDSNLAWFSRGEYLVNALQTSRLGVPFMNFLNRPGVTLSDVAKILGAPRFAVGGLLDGMSNSFSSLLSGPAFGGGLQPALAGASGGRPIVLDFGKGQTFGATMSDDDAKRLEKYAVRSQRVSAGRRQSSIR